MREPAMAMPTHDSWDWVFLYYLGTQVMRMRPAEFWRMTPRKLNALSRMHVEFKDPKKSKKAAGYIDQVLK